MKSFVCFAKRDGDEDEEEFAVDQEQASLNTCRAICKVLTPRAFIQIMLEYHVGKTFMSSVSLGKEKNLAFKDVKNS